MKRLKRGVSAFRGLGISRGDGYLAVTETPRVAACEVQLLVTVRGGREIGDRHRYEGTAHPNLNTVLYSGLDAR